MFLDVYVCVFDGVSVALYMRVSLFSRFTYLCINV